MMEMVALEAGKEPDWKAAETYIDSLTLDEIDDELLETCGVDPDNDPRDTWLATVKERLRSDLGRFRDDVESDRDEIELWELEQVRILASVGEAEEERDPDSAHGWMCRLVDSGALTAAGFQRAWKADLYRFA